MSRLPVREVKGLAVLSADLLSGAELPEWHRLRVDMFLGTALGMRAMVPSSGRASRYL